MKKLFGIRPGGLQRKTVLLVLALLAVTVAMVAAVSVYQNKMLVRIVGETRVEQQQAISQTSRETMHQIMLGTLASSTGLQARIAENDFSEVVNNVRILQVMAQELIEKKDSVTPAEFSLPDPSRDGTPSSMVLHEAGVDYTKSEYLGAVAHMSGPMIALFSSIDKINGCYIGLSDGTHFGIDRIFSNKYDEEGKLIPFPVRERPWYKGAVESGGVYFTGLERDAFNGSVGITCSSPVVVKGEIVGVVGIDIVLDKVSEFIDNSASESSFAVIVNDKGQVVLAPEDNGLFKEELSEEAQDLRRSENTELASFVQKALAEETDLTILNIGGKQYYAAGAPMPTIGWTVITIVDKEATEQPEKLLLEKYDSLNEEASAKFREGSDRTIKSSRIVLVLLVLVSIAVALYASGRIVRPLGEMTDSIIESGKTGKLFEMKDSYRTGDEIEVLAEAFDDLSKKTMQYIADITEITKEKERVNTELNMANQIQTSMLPHIFPPYPDRHEFDIFATMNPAKEVGGDFYDFFLIDEDHLALVMADVSGKGVPGALFMMVSKAILKNNAMMGKSVGEILAITNETICSNNKMQMFVTVWMGILEISTGKITAANAGHEYPAVMKNGRFELLKDKHGFVIGGMEGVRYHEYELQLGKGEKLFVYTDGVAEATNAEGELFGTDRMVDALNACVDGSSAEILAGVQKAVDVFVGDAEQFDDLTMLCLEYKGRKE